MALSRSHSKVKISSGIPSISDDTLEFLNTLLAKLPVLLLPPFWGLGVKAPETQTRLEGLLKPPLDRVSGFAHRCSIPL